MCVFTLWWIYSNDVTTILKLFILIVTYVPLCPVYHQKNFKCVTLKTPEINPTNI
jgi:hypothetical protein